jgi:hypothetical protein
MTNTKQKVAIIGAGIFGCSTAWTLAKNRYQVDLFEKNDDIMKAASFVNQYRIHRGYHYPRSKETIEDTKRGSKTFIEAYGEEILDKAVDHYYCIATKDSFVTPEEYKQVLKETGLEYEEVKLEIIDSQNIALTVKVKEELFDPYVLKKVCMERLDKYGVNLQLNKAVEYDDLDDYDLVVIATYSLNNNFLKNHPEKQRDYQFELCEKILVELPPEYAKKGVVVMDGPFTCFDPFGNTDKFLMGNVVHAIHQRTVGKFPMPPKEFESLLNSGIIKNPPITNFDKFIDSAKPFFVGIEKAKHLGSMYTDCIAKKGT